MKRTNILLYLIIVILIVIAAFIVFRPVSKNEKERTNKTEQKPLYLEGRIWFLSNDLSDTLVSIPVAVSDDPFERSRGLMYRYSMPDTVGMLFIYDRPDYLNFWMKNTHISLDIIFLDPNFKVIDIKQFTTPYSEDMIPSRGIAKYAVEVNAGFVQRIGIEIGDRISFRRM
jgi:uncharacterized membrane protein (UPF0127 family)